MRHGHVSPFGESLFGIAQKVTKKASPYTPLHPVVLATGGTRTNHPHAALTRSHRAHGQVYDRPLLRSSARAEGAIELTFVRFAMRTTGTRT